MTDSHDDDLDRTMRDAAHESLGSHQRSIDPIDVESALRATRAPIDNVDARRGGRRRLAAAALAAAAVVALVGALVVVTGENAEELEPTASEPSDVTEVATVPRPTDALATDSSSSAPLATVPETEVFDADGDRLDGFDATGEGSHVDRSAFVEVLRDYLLHRSDILGDSVAERERQLSGGGLRIHTTLDPVAQAAAESARAELPANSQNISTAVVSLDTTSGAVRAMIGTPTGHHESGFVNMAVTPRQTGSAAGLFVIAAGIEAGAQADDLIDARRGCRFPSDTPGDLDFVIESGVAGFVGSIRDVAARNVLCGTARLSQMVGLDVVVDTMYRTASSPYLDPDPDGAGLNRTPLEPLPSLAVGANEMSPLDMASGIQTVANEGIHHAPYFVEYIDDADGNRVYTHRSGGTRELVRDASLETIDVFEGVLTDGTARRHPLRDGRAAFGITGTQPDMTNAWFVGATTELATAVWVGDPEAYTPMVAIPEFEADGHPKVQGGTYPAQIWKAFTDAALAQTPVGDWPDPPAPERADARLVLPGVECLLPDPAAAPSPTNAPQQIPSMQPLTTVDIASAVVACE